MKTFEEDAMDKPRDSEEEYIRKEEIAKLRRQRAETARNTLEAERKRLKELHWMRCPKCGMELAEIDFKAVKVDACLTCGGMYLDKGEIEKVVGHKEPGRFQKAMSMIFRAGIQE